MMNSERANLFVVLLVLVEPVELEFLEHLVVDNGVVSADGIAISESANVVQKGVEQVVLEVDGVTDSNIAAGGGDITYSVSMSTLMGKHR